VEEPVDQSRLHQLLARPQGLYPGYLRDLEHLVSIDSGTDSKSGVDQVSAWMAERLRGLGGSVQRHRNTNLGDTLVATFEGAGGGPTVLMIGHADTVFDAGTAAARPFTIDGRRAHGPGVSDMKGGLLLGLGALTLLRERGSETRDWLPVGRLLFVINPDEEIGSPASSPIIATLASEADVALVLEGARPTGAIVSARSGMSHVRITIEGVAAHAGVEPEKGRSAILEAAHKTIALDALNGRVDGVTVNVGQLQGGTRPNIVADRATLTIDLRARRRSDQEQAEAAIKAIAASSTVPDVTSSIEMLARHWPMERTPASGRLVRRVMSLAAELGFELEEAAAGGSSDANTTAALGVPSIDGLGPVGGHAHAPSEYLDLDSVAPRMAMLAGLLAAIGREPPSGG
jgi:glutamate carboxypeptidase